MSHRNDSPIAVNDRSATGPWCPRSWSSATEPFCQDLVQTLALLGRELRGEFRDRLEVGLQHLAAQRAQLLDQRLDLVHVEVGLAEFAGERLADLADFHEALVP